MDKLTLTVGELYTAYMPFSEVCMHMRVAGKRLWFQVLPNRTVQLWQRNDAGKLQQFSFPILLGEAGVYEDEAGFYCYPMANAPQTVV